MDNPAVLRWSSDDVDAQRDVDTLIGVLEFIAGDERRVVACRTRTPEPHELGEFPMSCYECHMHADA